MRSELREYPRQEKPAISLVPLQNPTQRRTLPKLQRQAPHPLQEDRCTSYFPLRNVVLKVTSTPIFPYQCRHRSRARMESAFQDNVPNYLRKILQHYKSRGEPSRTQWQSQSPGRISILSERR